RITLHTRLVLWTTLAVTVYGTIFMAIGQAIHYWYPTGNAVLPDTMPDPGTATGLAKTIADAAFMSTTARTAGFNSVPMSELSSASQFVLMTLMFIGGSPGGTAGGIKTTTLSVLLLSVVATILARRETEVFARSIA